MNIINIMKNILIIAKMEKFKQENSMNRYNFLTFLNTKSNIEVIEDLPRSVFKSLELLKKKSQFVPDIVIYYCLSYRDWCKDIKIKYLDKLSIKKYLFMEDFHYTNVSINLYKTLKMDGIIHPMRHQKIDTYMLDKNIKCLIWGFYIDTTKFYNRKLKKEFDILFYGFTNPQAYALRCKILWYLQQIKKRYPHARIKIIPHPGYDKKSYTTPTEADLSILLNKSKFAIATSSYRNIFLKKYQEIPLSNCYLIGDIPTDYRDLLHGNIIELPRKNNDDLILRTLIDVLNGKYDHLLKDNTFREKMAKKYSFEAGYSRLNNLFA